MPFYQQEHRDRTVSSSEQPHSANVETAAAPSDGPLFTEGNAATRVIQRLASRSNTAVSFKKGTSRYRQTERQRGSERTG